MKKIAALSLALMCLVAAPLWAQTAPSQDDSVTVEATKVDDQKDNEDKTAAAQEDEEVTLVATKVDPKTVQQTTSQVTQAPQVQQPKKKKPLPIYLQPFEFVISSVVHAVCFWDKGD